MYERMCAMCVYASEPKYIIRVNLNPRIHSLKL